MNKADIVSAVASMTDYKKAAVGEIVEAVIDVVLNSLAGKEEVKIAGLGAFIVKEKPARKARNPKTGETVDVPAKTVVKFKPAVAVKVLFD